jgi:TorA-specific chaperone
MDSSAISTGEQQQAFLKTLKDMISVFWGPDPEKCAALLEPSVFDPFDQINALSGFHMSRALSEIKSMLQKISNADALYLHLEEAYVRLFISDRKGVTAPLYASCYETTPSGEKALLMGEPAIDMKKRFESKGLSLSDEIHEPPDHLSIELEYLYFLLDKGWADGDKDLIEEASTFAADVMLPWVSRFQAGLAAEKKCRFYPLMASVLQAILEIIAGFKHNSKNAR